MLPLGRLNTHKIVNLLPISHSMGAIYNITNQYQNESF